jgi:hypothetical protein
VEWQDNLQYFDSGLLMAMSVRSIFAVMVTSAVVASPAAGAVEFAAPGLTQDLPPVSVGVKSPPLWRFSKGQKQLIVLGTQLPLPESGVLDTGLIREYIAKSDVVLTGPGLRTGDGVSLLRGLTLASSIRNARRNDGGQSLKEVVPSDIYDKWQQLKAKYLGRDAGVEKQRPMYAAYELYSAALKQSGLTDSPMLGQVIAQATKNAGLKRVDARYSLPNENLRRTLKEFDIPRAADVGCLEKTLEGLDGYVEHSTAAAEAWAVGDVRRYRDAERSYQTIDGCWARLTNEAIARSGGVDNPYAMVDAAWLSAVHQALSQHDVVFTTLPARSLIENSGLAEKLQSEGFAVSQLFSER